MIPSPKLVVLGRDFGSPEGRYLLSLGIVLTLTVLARNLARSATGRSFMAIRDMDTAAAVMGIPIMRTKLLAFAVSAFYCGIAGVIWVFGYLGTVGPHGFDLDRSFQILFIIIIGGLGSISGAFLGAAFIVLLPILMDNIAVSFFSGIVDPGHLENVQKLVFGSLIIFFLIKEPEGLARLVALGKERVRAFPLSQ